MPIPAFRADGWLPEGHHAADWEEISAIFGGEPDSKRRRDLLEPPAAMARRPARQGNERTAYSQRQFHLAKRKRPGDVDAIFVFDEFTDALRESDPIAAELLDINRNKANGLGDIFIFADSTVKLHPTICRLDGFDLHKTTKAPKGVVEVEI